MQKGRYSGYLFTSADGDKIGVGVDVLRNVQPKRSFFNLLGPTIEDMNQLLNKQ